MMNAKEIANKAIAQAKADWVRSMTEDFYADEKKNPTEIGAIGLGNTIIVVYGDSIETPLVGVAKCNPNDRYDREIGIAIAYARAIGQPIPDYVLDDCSIGDYDEDDSYDEDEGYDEDWDDDDDDWDDDDSYDDEDEDEDDDWDDDEDEECVEFGEIGVGGKFIDDGDLFIKVSNDKAYRYDDKQTIDFDEGYVVDGIVTD
jgi:hypothetical protein